MSKEVFQNSEGSTGAVKIESGAPVFTPFASQEEADASLNPAQAQPEQDDRTVSELTAALEAAGVEIPSGAKKADLQKLAAQHGV